MKIKLNKKFKMSFKMIKRNKILKKINKILNKMKMNNQNKKNRKMNKRMNNKKMILMNRMKVNLKKKKEKLEEIKKNRILYYMVLRMIRWMNIMVLKIKIYMDFFVQVKEKNIYKKWD